MEVQNINSSASLLPCFPASRWCVWWGNAVTRREWRWNIMWSAADSVLIPLILLSSLSAERSEQVWLCLLQRMAEHPPFLKIGCAERVLKIDPPLITVSEIFISHSHLQTPLTITRVLQPLPHPCSRHRDSHSQPYMFWLHLTLVISTWTYSVPIPLRGRGKKYLQLTCLGFFSLLCSV